MKRSYKCDEKLSIYYPVNYKENLYQAKKLYMQGASLDPKRKGQVNITPPKKNMSALMKKYMNDYGRLMSSQKALKVKNEVVLDKKAYNEVKEYMQIIQSNYANELDFVDDINHAKEFNDNKSKTDFTIRKKKIKEDYDQRLGIPQKKKDKSKSNSSRKSHSSKEKEANQKKKKDLSKQNSVKENSVHQENLELHQSQDQIDKNNNDDANITRSNIEDYYEDEFNHEDNNSTNKIETSLPVPEMKESDLFETDQNFKMFTDIENRVLTSTKADIMNQNQKIEYKATNNLREKEDSIKRIQRYYRRHLENKKRKNVRFMSCCWDDKERNENLIMIFYDKTVDEPDRTGENKQVLSLFVEIHSRNKMETYEDIISISELVKLGVINENSITKKEIYGKRALIAKVLFEKYQKKALIELEKKKNEYALVFAENNHEVEYSPHTEESNKSSLKENREKDSLSLSNNEEEKKSVQSKSSHKSIKDDNDANSSDKMKKSKSKSIKDDNDANSSNKMKKSKSKSKSSLSDYKPDSFKESNSGFNIENNDDNYI